MKTSKEFENYNSRNSFKKIFDFKGEIAPIAEKANRNLELKTKNETNLVQRVHYFAIGHTFKYIDTETLFEWVVDEETQMKQPTKFLSLQSFDDSFCDELQKITVVGTNNEYNGLIPAIRNINSHYIHSFEKIRIDSLSPVMVKFLKESFELSVIQIYIKEENELKRSKNERLASTKEIIEQNGFGKRLVQFLCDKFYPVGNKTTYPEDYLEYRKQFRNLSKDEAIDSLLFVEVETAFDWLLFETYPAFNIAVGKYLSFYSCLFLLSMFLYKSEANQLISKIKQFKRNKIQEEKSKREIFTFFSKRFSSQDIDSEENHLVKFRDLIQYLNRYPVAWNKDIELESQHPVMTDRLKAKIIEMEIDSSFPIYAENNRFHVFAKYQIWGKKYFGKKIEKEYIEQSFNGNEVEEFSYEINTSPELKGFYLKLADLKSKPGLYEKHKAEIKRTETSIKELIEQNVPNPITEKLKTRIEKNLLFVSYGRNQDRFMDFATRYLAETNYFGNDARFKMYQFYTTTEQNKEYENLKEVKSKKEIDRLKFHHGRPIHFSTYSNHHKRYESWDTPFVFENNAIQVKMTLDHGIEKTVSIQRSLMVYLLEDALFKADKSMVDSAGKHLISEYFTHQQQDFNYSRLVLEQNESINTEQKNKFKKILPKRLLNHYLPAIQNNTPAFSTLQLILEKAKLAEERYKKLTEKVKTEGNYDDFIKRNKGKQFKLQFIRKAWHLMYFKESYKQQASFSGHHKRFHIERDEFNDFSRFMFAFDEVPAYKDYLKQLLDKKGFFENQQFKALFENGTSLDNLYVKTKQAYEKWLIGQNNRELEATKYTLQSYEQFFADDMFYINQSHFISFLESKSLLSRDEQGQMRFNALANCAFLVSEFYYTDKLDKTEYKTNRKLFNQLRSVRLEDALLYEMAMCYLKIDQQVVQKAKAHVIEILTQNVQFDICNSQDKLVYHLVIPFNKIDAYVELLNRKETDETISSGSSFITNVDKYIEMIWNEIPWKEKNENAKKITHAAMYPIGEKYSRQKTITYDDLQKIYQHLLSSSNKLTNVSMQIERYYLCKPDGQGHVVFNGETDRKTGCYLIRFEKTGVPKTYFGVGELNIRNKAFHFLITPSKSYEKWLMDVEREFILKEVKPNNPKAYTDLNRSVKLVCDILLNTLHNNYFKLTDSDKGIPKEEQGKQKQKNAQITYFTKHILY